MALNILAYFLLSLNLIDIIFFERNITKLSRINWGKSALVAIRLRQTHREATGFNLQLSPAPGLSLNFFFHGLTRQNRFTPMFEPQHGPGEPAGVARAAPGSEPPGPARAGIGSRLSP